MIDLNGCFSHIGPYENGGSELRDRGGRETEMREVFFGDRVNNHGF